jgi:hypothetical protein
MSLTRLLVPAALLALATPAGAADRTSFAARTMVEPAAPGLAVSGALSGYHVTSRARVVVPTRWRALRAPAGQLRFLVTQNQSCAYSLTYAVRSRLAATQEASAYVAAALPSAGPRYVIDAGTHGNGAFRVVRQPGGAGRIRLDALWAGVLTRRADIAAAGQTAWTEIRVTAVSHPGDECHSGTWRQALGPSIGDSLAVARTGLRFTNDTTPRRAVS